MTVSVILLCGGKGTRFKSALPKQYLGFQGKELALHSFDFFSQIEEVKEIIVVCEENYQKIFASSKIVKFSSPGDRRQDSVYSGLKKTGDNIDLICIHDGVRPFLKKDEVKKCFALALKHGAAVLGSKIQNTLKSVKNNFIEKTIDREFLYEVYTPQVFKKNILLKGFDFAIKNNLTVTDDAALLELMGGKVSMVEGSKNNIKITTPFDLKLAEAIYEKTL